jgi:hypothetical protein
MQHTFMQPILAAKNAAAHKSPMSSKYRCCRRASASFQLPCGAPSSLSRIQTSLAIQQLLLQRYKSVTNGHMRKQPDALGRRIKANESCEPATNVPRTIAHVTNSGPVALFHPFRDDGALSGRCFGKNGGRAHMRHAAAFEVRWQSPCRGFRGRENHTPAIDPMECEAPHARRHCSKLRG